jgi:hypothetical protein
MLPSKALPRRLRELTAYITKSKRDEFGDWQLARKRPLSDFYPPEEAEIVAEAAKRFAPIAGDWGGGVLALDLGAEDIERAAVVAFDSEGGITVLGNSFDDFLALLVSDEPVTVDNCWEAEGEVRTWILDSGIRSLPSAEAHLTELAAMTHTTWRSSRRARSWS